MNKTEAEGNVLVVTPKGLPMVSLALALDVQGNTRLLVEVLANDDAHKGRIAAQLAQLKTENLEIKVTPWKDVRSRMTGEPALNPIDAASILELNHWSNGMETHKVTGTSSLEALFAFLKIPMAIGSGEALRAIAQNSNRFWT